MGSSNPLAFFKNLKALFTMGDRMTPVNEQLREQYQTGVNPITGASVPTSRIGPPRGLLQKARSKYMRYTPNVLQDALANLVTGAELLGFGDPSGAYSGPVNQATINMLIKSGKGSPQLRRALEFIQKKYPRASENLSDVSRFSDDILKTKRGQSVYGKYNKGTTPFGRSEVDIALNDPSGLPISDEHIVGTIGHEMFGHGAQFRKTPGSYPKNVKELGGGQLLEDKAERAGRTLVNRLKKEGIIEGSPVPNPEVQSLQLKNATKVTTPTGTYADGVKLKNMASQTGGEIGGGKNIWARSDKSGSNKDRTLMVQFSDKLTASPTEGSAVGYYEKLYSGARPGFDKADDFWELPDWQARLSHTVPKADSYVVRDVDEAAKFLNEAGYNRVAFSAMDVNKDFIVDVAKKYKGQIDLGGYGDMGMFKGLDNVKIHKDLDSFVTSTGNKMQHGVNYGLFKGTKTVPRLTMSTGCKHCCSFCTVEKALKEAPGEQIMAQADEIAKNLDSKIVYLNDKTFGQAKNHKMLPDVYKRIKSQNPDFQGFVAQTTSPQFNKMTPEFLEDSGIKYVELGMETYNDDILRQLQKPSTEALLNKSFDKARETGTALVPNVMIGLPGETAESYAKTLKFLRDNEDVISHVNVYNLALYKEAPLSKTLKIKGASDVNENVLQKSWMGSVDFHKQFSEDVFRFGSGRLQKPMTKINNERLRSALKR